MTRMPLWLALAVCLLGGVSCKADADDACEALGRMARERGLDDKDLTDPKRCADGLRERVESVCENPADLYACLAEIDSPTGYYSCKKTCEIRGRACEETGMGESLRWPCHD